MNITAISSLPRTKAGKIDLFEMYRLCSKFNIDTQVLEDLEPWEFILVLEGKVEAQREYFEFLCYSLYSSVGQVLSTKSKKFENPFEKKEDEIKEKPSKEVQEKTMEILEKTFGITTNVAKKDEQ